jgi:hypothetical protein
MGVPGKTNKLYEKSENTYRHAIKDLRGRLCSVRVFAFSTLWIGKTL